ncbi:methyltransferase domain-containing protein [Streptomyces sp. SID10853]|uniref:class I SAM-dependent methyltransferase n=1 Tax=Streptomyces sp. SID10853 TaxID=2706028 RepID=UPI0013BF9219|nr:class I SAM-dependent methyltransferase [Streptomyces sp. SID10853]NDZ83247.1 methyltransferase domain-containing protein [Streptomyces sp. SID10853]
MFSHQDEQEWLQQEREINAAVGDGGFGPADRLSSWTERSPFALCQYFLLRLGGTTWLGRKLVPEDRTDPSSVLTPRMLMGEFESLRFTRQRVEFYFTARSAQAHADTLARASKDPEADLDFPFPRLDRDWNEALVPAYVWDGTAELTDSLDPDEEHFRAAAAIVLRDVVRPGDTVYDPACSTGRFVSSLGAAFPECRVLASDASQKMVELARRRIPDAFVADGLSMPVPERSVQVLVLRFLNAEVLSADAAVDGFRSLTRLIAPGGHALVFGHTPVLPAVRHLAGELGLEVRSSVGAVPGRPDEVFQFYLLSRPAATV